MIGTSINSGNPESKRMLASNLKSAAVYAEIVGLWFDGQEAATTLKHLAARVLASADKDEQATEARQ